MITNRITRDKDYKRPTETYQQTLGNTEIKEKLKDYKKIDDIRKLSIGTHVRYFTKEKVFRLGGNLNKIDPEGRYVVLSNGKVTWSVQLGGTQFWGKMSENEFKEELKKQVRKELTEEQPDDVDLKKQVKQMYRKLEEYEQKYSQVKSENEVLSSQLKSIENEIIKQKTKTKNKK